MNNLEQSLEENYFGALAIFMLETRVKNEGGGLDDDEVGEAELSEAELSELERLEQKAGIPWEELYDVAERCVANGCIANRELIPCGDAKLRAKKRPTLLAGLFTVPPVKVCTLCGGRGWVAAQPGAFPGIIRFLLCNFCFERQHCYGGFIEGDLGLGLR